MEIGVREGYNARSMCELLQPSKLVCVDPWDESTTNFEEAVRNLEDYKCVEFMCQCSQEVLPNVPSDSFDFIYIDGDHNKEVCANDVRQALRLVRLYGLVGGHDYGLPPQVIKLPYERYPLHFDSDIYASVHSAIHSVLDGKYVDSLDCDWWVVVTPDIKHLVVQGT